MGNRMWMIRGDGGKLYDDFRDKQIVGIGWSQLAPLVKPGLSRAQLLALYQEADPLTKLGTARSGASQVWRFVNEIQKGDWVITYSPANRTYLLGKDTSDFQYHPEWVEEGMGIARQVKWNTQEIDRDRLSVATKNTLGSTLTVFQLPEYALEELLQDKKPTVDVITQNPIVMDEDEVVSDPLRDMEMLAFEGIKDRINSLDWDEMQNLVAGVLRSMGYKTQVSPAGADRGKDIIASPDGFGFENPRIIVEVKHRREQMGSQQIRSFIGGRHKDDRGLYVSTGGFTKDARYEADRSTIPLTLWTLDDLVRALIENYEQVDIETKLLVPLKKLSCLREYCFDSHIGVLLVWLYTHSQCLFFIRILTCGYKCGYNYLFLFLNIIDISLLGVKFESGLRTHPLNTSFLCHSTNPSCG